jgi:dolichol-phosphate mannosyltransferase
LSRPVGDKPAGQPPRVAIVSPTYNERDNIGAFIRRLGPYLQSSGGRVSVLFVDDNSPDGTGAEIRRIMQTNPGFQILERRGKGGLGTAYFDGFRRVLDSGDVDVVVQMDADLQHPPELVSSLVAKVSSGGVDVAIASRKVKGGRSTGLNSRRRLISGGAAWFSRTVLGLPVKDTTTGFKALRRSAVECLLAHPPRTTGFVFQVESLYILKKNGFKMAEVPFDFEKREKGVSKMGNGEISGFLLGVLRIRFRKY